MIVIDSACKIMKLDELAQEYGDNREAFFEVHGDEFIIDLGENRYSTYRQIKGGIAPADIRVAYDPDMFRNGRQIFGQFGYAIAETGDGNCRVIMREGKYSYWHHYKYSGGVDMWFLDEYECIFLHGCNEYSVELCQTVMRLWKGQRLVLVGKEWDGLIPMLPDLPGIECFYEEAIYNERIQELTETRRSLHIVHGIPQAESIQRYEMGIMTYDEVMSFAFMFSDYRELGEKIQINTFSLWMDITIIWGYLQCLKRLSVVLDMRKAVALYQLFD